MARGEGSMPFAMPCNSSEAPHNAAQQFLYSFVALVRGPVHMFLGHAVSSDEFRPMCLWGG